ncbi:MAG TPA: hypothetical protein VJA21_05065, partial [Verrucomicrobiae bacterium]
LWARNPPSPDILARFKDRFGLWLAAGSREDIAGRIWDAHAPLHLAPERRAIEQMISQAGNVPVVLDAVLTSQDEEYLDVSMLEAAARSGARPPYAGSGSSGENP